MRYAGLLIMLGVLAFCGCTPETVEQTEPDREPVKVAVRQDWNRRMFERVGQRPGTYTTESGLRYRILRHGPPGGQRPTRVDAVTAHYTGWLVNGTVFIDTRRGEPATFPVDGVIRGMAEALLRMRVGDRWQLFIPPELAHGRGEAGPIPSGSVMIIDIELIDIPTQPKPRRSAGAPRAP